MTTNYQQPGEVMDWTNATGSDVASGDIVPVSGVLGCALVDIANGVSGSVQITGVFVAPKVSGAVIAQGETLTWDVSAGAFDDNAATAATGDITGAAAIAWEAAGDGATTLAVKLTGIPGTVN